MDNGLYEFVCATTWCVLLSCLPIRRCNVYFPRRYQYRLPLSSSTNDATWFCDAPRLSRQLTRDTVLCGTCVGREHQAAGRRADDRSLGSGAGAGGSSSVSSYFLHQECFNGLAGVPCATAEDPEPPARPPTRLPSSNRPTGEAQDEMICRGIGDEFSAATWRPARASAVPGGR
jgi:hypothetical protein